MKELERCLFLGITPSNKKSKKDTICLALKPVNKDYSTFISLKKYPKLKKFIDHPEEISRKNFVKGLNYHFLRTKFKIGPKRNPFHDNFYHVIVKSGLVGTINSLCEELSIACQKPYYSLVARAS